MLPWRLALLLLHGHVASSATLDESVSPRTSSKRRARGVGAWGSAPRGQLRAQTQAEHAGLNQVTPPTDRELLSGHTDDAYRECAKRDPFHNRSGGGLAFIHIPKAAGTLIEDIAMKHGVRWGRRCLYGMQQMPDGYYCSRHHVPPQLAPQVYHGLETFCVTRHPYERAVSEYRYLLSVPWGKDQKPGLYDQAPCTQEGLNHFIQTGLELAKRFRMFGIVDGHTDGYKYVNDCHMLPQSDYIWGRPRHGWYRRFLGAGAEKMYCHHPLRMEKLQEDFNQLMRDKGYPFQLEATRRMNTFEETCPHLSVKNLSQPTRAIIQDVYRHDFQRFGYCTQCM